MENSHPSLAEVERFWDARPCNLRHSDKPVGSREYFDEVTKKKHFVEPHIPRFAEFGRWKGKRVLEVGCGLATDGLQFALNGAEYVGVDISSSSIELARKRFEVYGVPGEFVHGNAEELQSVVGLKGADFDLIWSFGVLHHTPSIEKSLEQIRSLSTAGKTELRIMVYAKNSWKQRLINEGFDQPEAQSGCPIANSYDPEEITGLLFEAGFRVRSIEQTHIFPYKVDEYKAHEYVKEDWFAAMPAPLFEALERTLGWHLLVVADPI